MARPSNELNVNMRPSHLGGSKAMMSECDSQREDFEMMVGEVRDSLSQYLQKRPMIASGIVFLAGFYIGWKIKPW